MSAAASTAGIVCVIAIASSLISLIVPQGSNKRAVNAVVGVFILCSLIIPFKNAFFNSDFNFDLPEYSDNLSASADEAYEKALLTETKSKLESSLVSYLLNKGYKIKTAEITLNSKFKAGIYIESICIYIYKSEVKRSLEIIKLTEEKYETTPKLRMI